MRSRILTRIAPACATLLLAAAPAAAQVAVTDAWVRATVPQQQTSGVYMTLTAAQDARLVGASSPVAAAVEIHQTRMGNNTARMRHARAIELPAAKSVELKPGGYHLMLLGLKRQMKEGESVSIRLIVENKSGNPSSTEIKARVRPIGAAADHQHAD